MCAVKNRRIGRREVLRHGVKGLAALTALGGLTPHFAYGVGASAPRRGRSLVVIIKDGGEDTTYTMPPLGAIASEIAQVRPTVNVTPSNTLDVLNGSIGLHPLYAPIVPIIERGHFKVIQGCGFPTHSSSHQDAQNHFSHAARHLTGQMATQGWPARIKDLYNLSMYQVAGFNTGQRIDLRSKEPSLIVSDFGMYQYLDRGSALGGTPLSEMTREVLEDMLVQFPSSFSAESTSRDGIRAMLDSVSTVQSVNATTVTTSYPTIGVGADLQRVAKMMRWRQQRSPQENALYLVRIGGYDTHSNQVSLLNTLIDREAKGLAAFAQDLTTWGLWNSTTILTISEFSRTLRENNGGGTDHARGTSISVLGGAIKGNGSRSVVEAPLTSNDISRNHQAPVHYYREVVKEILEWWGVSSSDMASVLPESAPQTQSFSLYA
jgi:uncharacterized protein (DUF1501 family)